MFDTMDMPAQTHGKNGTAPVYFRAPSAPKRTDGTFRPECERLAGLTADADVQRLFSRLPSGQSWQRRVCARFGRWLETLGRTLESYGNQPSVHASSAGLSSH